jgi:hypothetical protein
VVWQNLARNGGKTGTSTEEFIRSTLEEANCQYFAEGQALRELEADP